MIHKEIYQALIDGKTIIDHSRDSCKYTLNDLGILVHNSGPNKYVPTDQGFRYPDECEIHEEPKYQVLFEYDGVYKITGDLYSSEVEFNNNKWSNSSKFIKLLKPEDL